MTGRPRFLVYRLFGRCHHRYDGDVGAAFGFGCELNFSIIECEQRVIRAHADIATGMPRGTALTNEDVAGNRGLAARLLQAKATARGVAAVAGRTACFFMCHRTALSNFAIYIHRFREGIISLFLATSWPWQQVSCGPGPWQRAFSSWPV